MRLFLCLFFWAAALSPAPLAAQNQPSEPGGGLHLVNIALHQFEDGPSLPSSYAFRPGETVFLSFQVSGFKADGLNQIRLVCEFQPMDAQGVKLQPGQNRTVDTELAPQDKDWLPKIRYSAVVPPLIRNGEYRIVVAIKDQIGGAGVRQQIPFAVRGKDVEPSASLAIRSLRFLRAEDETEALSVAAFRPGSMLWARFEVTGFKLGENNQVNVEYGLEVLSAAGDVLFSQPQAAREEDSSFYPKHYVPGLLSLNLTPEVQNGDYVLRVVARDLVGNQETDAKAAFSVQ